MTSRVNPYSVGLPSTNYEGLLLAHSPVGMWMMDETSGNFIDQGSTGNDATPSSGVTHANRTIFGHTAPDFSGSIGGYAAITHNAALEPWAGAGAKATYITMCRFDALTSWTMLLSKGASYFGPMNGSYLWYTNHAGLGVTHMGSTAASLNTDYVFAWTLDQAAGPRVKLYVNGVLVNDKTFVSGTASASPEPVYISRYSSDNYHVNGAIAGTALFDKVLTQTEITELYDAAVAGP